MSEHGYDFPKTTGLQVVLAILGALIAPTLVIVMIAKLFLTVDANHLADSSPAVADQQILDRIKPVAVVEVAAVESGPHVDKTGQEVVGAVCSACHAVGALGSPKIGDKAAWAPRIKQGYETLIKHAISGIRSMPPRGGNPELTDGEIANAIAYMANQSGAKFTPPKPAAAATPAAASPADSSPAAAPVKAETPAPAPVKVADNAAASGGKTGEEVVGAVCSACHAVGALGSPKIGDKAAWAPRIAQGYDTLKDHANKGYKMMPAKGGNPALSDVEIARAIAYMANQSGASFKAP